MEKLKEAEGYIIYKPTQGERIPPALDGLPKYLRNLVVWIEKFYSNVAGRINRLLKITVDSDGNVGIRNTAPGCVLNVGDSTTKNTTIRLTGSATDTEDVYAFTFGFNSTDVDYGGVKIDYSGRAITGLEIFTHSSANYPIRLTPGPNTDIILNVSGTGSVGIGTTSPAASAKLDISSTVGAVLLPRMTTAQRNALTAVNGMLIYNTTTTKIEGYENGSWVDI